MQPCPRQTNEATLPVQMEHKSHWREDGTCSYCGSLSPEKFFQAVEAGCKLVPTDKNYKAYIDLPHPNVGEPCVTASSNAEHAGWTKVTPENINELPLDDYQRKNYMGRWVHVTVRGPIDTKKFYFQHLTEEEMIKFIGLYNAKKINFGMPGYFYTSPFFMKPA